MPRTVKPQHLRLGSTLIPLSGGLTLGLKAELLLFLVAGRTGRVYRSDLLGDDPFNAGDRDLLGDNCWGWRWSWLRGTHY